MEYHVFFFGASKGTTERGDYYKVTLSVAITADGREQAYSCDFFVDAVMYAKVSAFKRFQEVDAIFLPTGAGKARLLSIEPL